MNTSDMIDPALLQKPILARDWSTACFMVFGETKILTVGQLAGMTARELFALHTHFGFACLEEVRRNLASVGLKLKGD